MTDTFTVTVIPAQAGIQIKTIHTTQWDNTSNMALSATRRLIDELDSRLRGNDDAVVLHTIAFV
jgi:hypothetical protein